MRLINGRKKLDEVEMGNKRTFMPQKMLLGFAVGIILSGMACNYFCYSRVQVSRQCRCRRVERVSTRYRQCRSQK